MSRNLSEAGISHNPNPSRLVNTNEHASVLEELTEMDRVWWGRDLECARDTRIEPGQTTEVELTFTRDSLPPIDIPERDVETVIRALEGDVRSRYAHLGLQLVQSKKPRTVDLERGTVTVNVTGLGGRPVELPKGEGLLSFFSIGGNADYLQRERLVLEAASVIKGNFGEAWQLVVPQRMAISKNLNRISSATAVALMLNKKKRYMIPQNEISVKLAGERDYRRYLADHKVFQRIGKKQTPPPFWVGETVAKVDLPKKKGIVGVLGVMAYVNRQWVYQTESRLIKPGETPKWEIRHEFSNPTGKSEQSGRPEEAQDPYGLGTQYLVMYLIQQP